MNALRRIYCGLLIVALAVSLTACSSQPTTEASGSRPAAAPGPAMPHGEAILAALRASQVGRNAKEALSFIERALAQSPNQPELVWLAARLCGDVPRCEPQEYETRLRKLDPGNGAVWIGPLSRAQDKADAAAEEQILQALGREARFDVYWNRLLWQAAVVLSAESPQPKPKVLNGPLTNAINDVANWLTAVAMPSFADLANACHRDRTQQAAIAERCRAVANVLQQGDTFAAQAVGIGIAQRAAPPDSPATIALAEQAAVLQYQLDTAVAIMGEQVEREKLSAERIELMKKLRREQDVSLAVLRWAGVPLMPPRN